MNSALEITKIGTRISFAFLVVASAIALLNRANSGAESSATSRKRAQATRRLFENRVPEHLPIKVKIRREKERLFRDLKNENWARDFELEVKNIGSKPIYFLFFHLHVPDAKISNSYQAFSIVYGRLALGDLNNRPTPDDIPIGPGETKILRLDGTQIRGWDEARAAGLVPHAIRGVKVTLDDLTFGDGTGFEGTTGAPKSKVDKLKAGACLPPIDRYGGPRGLKRQSITLIITLTSLTNCMPAHSSRHLFYTWDQSLAYYVRCAYQLCSIRIVTA